MKNPLDNKASESTSSTKEVMKELKVDTDTVNPKKRMREEDVAEPQEKILKTADPISIPTLTEVELRGYFDFDGCLTGADGSTLVNSAFYKSLLENPKIHYVHATFMSHDALLEKITVAFKEAENQHFKISAGAIDYLKFILEQRAEIHIISKNREEYIKAVLLIAGLTEAELAKINIVDIRHGGADKEIRVTEIETNSKTLAKQILVLDDSQADCQAMKNGVKKLGKTCTAICKAPGSFPWSTLKEEFCAKNTSFTPRK